jgi:hypothetical protein
VPKSKKQQAPAGGIPIKGAFRLNIVEDGEIVYDSGVCENSVTAVGYNGLALLLLSAANSTNGIAKYLALGTGAASVNPSTTILPGELSHAGAPARVTFGANSQVSQTDSSHATAIMSATFPSGSTGMTGNIANLGLYVASTGSNLLAGQTLAGGSQALSSNQAVNVTYSVALG